MLRQFFIETVQERAPCFVSGLRGFFMPRVRTSIAFTVQDHNDPSISSHNAQARLPSLANSLDLLNKFLTRNLTPLRPPTSNSHRRMFIRHIKRVLQQSYIRRLQRLECLVDTPHISISYSLLTISPSPRSTSHILSITKATSSK